MSNFVDGFTKEAGKRMDTLFQMPEEERSLIQQTARDFRRVYPNPESYFHLENGTKISAYEWRLASLGLLSPDTAVAEKELSTMLQYVQSAEDLKRQMDEIPGEIVEIKTESGVFKVKVPFTNDQTTQPKRTPAANHPWRYNG